MSINLAIDIFIPQNCWFLAFFSRESNLSVTYSLILCRPREEFHPLTADLFLGMPSQPHALKHLVIPSAHISLAPFVVVLK